MRLTAEDKRELLETLGAGHPYHGVPAKVRQLINDLAASEAARAALREAVESLIAEYQNDEGNDTDWMGALQRLSAALVRDKEIG